MDWSRSIFTFDREAPAGPAMGRLLPFWQCRMDAQAVFHSRCGSHNSSHAAGDRDPMHRQQGKAGFRTHLSVFNQE
ncbi:hypothetical protein PE066_07200 [Ramlibacter tataouinensis]|uniref:hypothetical protein n=1 Tax=Ramlibacter tataouinensis TaxID=94132 RepID=UPI0022F3E83F|nr:hypothetical protein [Ramlibacter tataouinensis]WBY03312.1 hypothetical protein PE066_07200 [Ramlibacter tataouinensis]